jgi:hypothetical protein
LLSTAAIAKGAGLRVIAVLLVAKVSPGNVGEQDSLSQGAANSPADKVFRASAVFLAASVDSAAGATLIAAAISDPTADLVASTLVMALLMDTGTIPAMPTIQLILTDRPPHSEPALTAHTIGMEGGPLIPTAIPTNSNIRRHRRTTINIRHNRTTIPIHSSIGSLSRTTIPISVNGTINNPYTPTVVSNTE